MRALAPAALSPGRYAPPHKDAARGAHLTGRAGGSEGALLHSGAHPESRWNSSDHPARHQPLSGECARTEVGG